MYDIGLETVGTVDRWQGVRSVKKGRERSISMFIITYIIIYIFFFYIIYDI